MYHLVGTSLGLRNQKRCIQHLSIRINLVEKLSDQSSVGFQMVQRITGLMRFQSFWNPTLDL